MIDIIDLADEQEEALFITSNINKKSDVEKLNQIREVQTYMKME